MEIVERFVNHQSFDVFKQNADFGEEVSELAQNKKRIIRAFHWWIHEVELEDIFLGTNRSFSEEEITAIEVGLQAGHYDNFILGLET